MKRWVGTLFTWLKGELVPAALILVGALLAAFAIFHHDVREFLNSNSSLVQSVSVILLALITGIYAWHTREMARETRNLFLSEDRPVLLLDLLGKTWPTELQCKVRNAGRGPAKDVHVTYAYPSRDFNHPRKGYLAPGEEWEVKLASTPVTKADPSSGFKAQLRSYGVKGSRNFPKKFHWDGGFIVTYKDIHSARWISYWIPFIEDDPDMQASSLLLVLASDILTLPTLFDQQIERLP